MLKKFNIQPITIFLFAIMVILLVVMLFQRQNYKDELKQLRNANKELKKDNQRLDKAYKLLEQELDSIDNDIQDKKDDVKNKEEQQNDNDDKADSTIISIGNYPDRALDSTIRAYKFTKGY